MSEREKHCATPATRQVASMASPRSKFSTLEQICTDMHGHVVSKLHGLAVEPRGGVVLVGVGAAEDDKSVGSAAASTRGFRDAQKVSWKPYGVTVKSFPADACRPTGSPKLAGTGCPVGRGGLSRLYGHRAFPPCEVRPRVRHRGVDGLSRGSASLVRRAN